MEPAHGEPIIDNGLAGARRVIGLLPCRSHLLRHPNRLRSQQSVVVGLSLYLYPNWNPVLQAAFWIGRPW